MARKKKVEEYAEELKKGITEGNVTYEELKSGDKVILDRALLHWYPDIKVGDKLKLNIHDGDNTFQKEICLRHSQVLRRLIVLVPVTVVNVQTLRRATTLARPHRLADLPRKARPD